MIRQQLYFLALIPPEPIRNAVKLLKEEMLDRFGAGHALKSPAHITLQMPFRRTEQEEENMIGQLEKFAAGERPFPIELSGFGCFEPRVIYVSIHQHDRIVQLHQRLRACLLEIMQFAEEEVGARFHPHMTIATRDLRKNAFRQAWPEFEKRTYTASFTADSLYLLKHNGKHWDIYRQFEFAKQSA